MTRATNNAYPWYRMYTEARTDTKLRALTKPQHYVWFNLLCLSADQPERGAITGYESELLAVEVSDGDETLLAETLDRLIRFRILEAVEGGWRFINFQRRQYDKPSDTPENTSARKAASRERAAESRPGQAMSRDVTPSHAMSRPGHAESRLDAEAEGDAEGETEAEQDTELDPSADVAAVVTPRARARAAGADSSDNDSDQLVRLCERIAKRTQQPQRVEIMDQLAEVLQGHLARGLSPGDIERDVLNLVDPSRPGYTKKPTISQISNWLTRTHPAENLAALAAVSASNGHRPPRGDAANGHYIRRRREADLPDPTQNGKYAHRFTVVGDDDVEDPGDA